MEAHEIETLSRVEATAPALVRAYLSKVYTWMAFSLLVTTGTALYSAHSEATLAWMMAHPWLPVIGMLGIVVVMAFGARALTSGALAVLLLTFSAVLGLVFAPILLLYTTHSLALTFASTAGMFGAMAFYGATTKRNLSGMGRTLMMLLFGLIIAGIANIFWGNSTMDLIVSVIGVVVFSLFTAYDTQRILEQGLCTDEETRRKGAVLGALTLYLDFINLFLYLLRFLGRSR